MILLLAPLRCFPRVFKRVSPILRPLFFSCALRESPLSYLPLSLSLFPSISVSRNLEAPLTRYRLGRLVLRRLGVASFETLLLENSRRGSFNRRSPPGFLLGSLLLSRVPEGTFSTRVIASDSRASTVDRQRSNVTTVSELLDRQAGGLIRRKSRAEGYSPRRSF